MLVRPAIPDDESLLFSCWGTNPSVNKDAWFSRFTNNRDIEVLVAEQKGEKVGSIILGKSGDMRWAIAPSHRGMKLGKRMVALVAQPQHVASIPCRDGASQAIARHAGFDLVENGEIQSWKAIRSKPYC